ncbi:DUF4199 domain-containing protein [Lacibacter luteus]|uniref:DUF4199 domain-containing protein n=1 Tax=Lacibacter luteus TaxID=2508719 RepID=A0A4Q1CKU9_9BACT|nr:DUF4199 domain-containing protein [Lacibacter luteus]RXK61593.1 DUF4199 domain-containing protein [Lacibacter luteus]
METKQSNPLLQFGLLSALIGVIAYIGLYLGGVKILMSPLAFVTSYVLPIIFAVMACIAAKKQNHGFLEFGKALKISFGVFVLTALAVSVLSYILFNFIDLEFKQAMVEESLNMSEKMLKKFGASQDQIEKAMDEARKKDSFSIGNMLLGFAFSCFIYFLFSLIIAAIVKKKNPENEMPQTL